MERKDLLVLCLGESRIFGRDRTTFRILSHNCMSTTDVYTSSLLPEALDTSNPMQQSRSISSPIIESLNMLSRAVHTKLIMLRDPISNFINMRARHPLAARHKRRTITEQLVHIFQIKPFRLRLETPEEDRVEEVADDENEVEFLASVSANSHMILERFDRKMATYPADRSDGNWSHLADHRVESEGSHRSPRHTFQTHRRSKEFGWNCPA
jgi:hypothetical protein